MAGGLCGADACDGVDGQGCALEVVIYASKDSRLCRES